MKRKLKWLPNFLTWLRIVAGPAITFATYADYRQTALALTVFAIATDWGDGYLAKNYGWQTPHGQYLDPLADKVFGLFVFLTIFHHYTSQRGFLDAHVVIFSILGVYVFWYSVKTSKMRNRGQIKGANLVAKRKTFVQMVAKVVFMTHIAYQDSLWEAASGALLWTALVIMAASAIMCYRALQIYVEQTQSTKAIA